MIIFDSLRSDNPFVVMSLDDYEKIIVNKSEVRGLTEDELLDKINRDIAIWKSEQNDQNETSVKHLDNVNNFANIPKNSNYLDYGNDYGEEMVENDEEGVDEKKEKNNHKQKNHWTIPSERKIAAEEIIEEDRQYLEDINL